MTCALITLKSRHAVANTGSMFGSLAFLCSGCFRLVKAAHVHSPGSCLLWGKCPLHTVCHLHPHWEWEQCARRDPSTLAKTAAQPCRSRGPWLDAMTFSSPTVTLALDRPRHIAESVNKACCSAGHMSRVLMFSPRLCLRCGCGSSTALPFLQEQRFP